MLVKYFMRFKEELNIYQDKINNELRNFLHKEIKEQKDNILKEIYILIEDCVLVGGKRLRPALLDATYKAIKKEENKEVLKTASCIEILHSSTLFHDDIMDQDFTRRNKPNLNYLLKDYFEENLKEFKKPDLFKDDKTKFIISQAILAGNILSSLSVKTLLESKFDSDKIIKSIRILNHANRTVNKGQVRDIEFEFKDNITEKEYLEMIELKTSNLFVASVQIGAILSDASEQQYKALTEYGINIGRAFQIQDDIMDIFIPEGKGNTSGSDIKEGKCTLLTVKAKEKASPEQRKKLNSILGNEKASISEIEEIAKIIIDTGSLEYSQKIALEHIKKAKTALLNAKIESDFLIGFADFMLERKI